jgi:hypothetical protein
MMRQTILHAAAAAVAAAAAAAARVQVHFV